MGFMEYLSGLGSGAQLRKLQRVADQVNSIEDEFQAMSDAELRAETDAFRKRIADGESLAEFVEAAVRASVERRCLQADFIARGLRSRDEAKRTGGYIDADEVVAGLQSKLDDARDRLSTLPKTYE